jgi:cell division protein FtsA
VTRDRRLVAGLDLGSTKTCAVIAEVVGDLPRTPLAKVLGVGLAKNSGVRRGVVRDIEETTAGDRGAARCGACRASGADAASREHVSARAFAWGRQRDEITAGDVARVNEVARAVSLGPDQELLHDIPQEYMVDQQRGISDPVGMTGMRLEVEMYLVTVQSTAAQNLRKAVQRAGYRVADLVRATTPYVPPTTRELGVALVEVGGGSTGVAIFHEGKIRHVASLKYAGAHVTNDLVQGLGVTQADAERLKERHGIAYAPLVDASEMINLPSTPGQGARQASRELLSHIFISGWTRSSCWWVASSSAPGTAAAGSRGVVLTGGTAHLPAWSSWRAKPRGAGGSGHPSWGSPAGGQRASAALRGAGGARAVRRAAGGARSGRRGGGRGGRWRRAAAGTAQTVAAGFLLIEGPREP